MCGIAGIYFFNASQKNHFVDFNSVLSALNHRGPDSKNYYVSEKCILFHARLSIIDLSEMSNQPFLNEQKNKAMTYNGEIFNYKQLQSELHELKSSGDVEVLFKLFEKRGLDCLSSLNGFFAFAFYDKLNDSMYLVRDRYGVKPLYYYIDEEKFAFASELKALMYMVGKQELNTNALYSYLRLNYISGKETIFKNVYRLMPGEYLSLVKDKIELKNWYQFPKKKNINNSNLKTLLENAVSLRLNADVPLGSFLSGGIDSSVISAIAAKLHPNLQTFSIGFSEDPFFDETKYANLVAKQINSKHHAFQLTSTDFLNYLPEFLNSIDEPFADSSALNVYVLSKLTQKHVKVALSGDGADELFMGYNKHKAELMAQSAVYKNIVRFSYPFASLFNTSRNSYFGNKARQINRFYESFNLSEKERYVNWACISSQRDTENLLMNSVGKNYFLSIFEESFKQSDFNSVNYADIKIVLADDMLVKVDRMSMRHGLEVRNPFLDYRIVEYALNLPLNEKINGNGQKLILQKQFKNLVPDEIFKRQKKGFELPLWKWLSSDLKNNIETKWLNEEAIKQHRLFNYEAVEKLKQQLFSKSPGDSPSKIWALIVFQNWYSNFKNHIK